MNYRERTSHYGHDHAQRALPSTLAEHFRRHGGSYGDDRRTSSRDEGHCWGRHAVVDDSPSKYGLPSLLMPLT